MTSMNNSRSGKVPGARSGQKRTTYAQIKVKPPVPCDKEMLRDMSLMTHSTNSQKRLAGTAIAVNKRVDLELATPQFSMHDLIEEQSLNVRSYDVEPAVAKQADTSLEKTSKSDSAWETELLDVLGLLIKKASESDDENIETSTSHLKKAFLESILTKRTRDSRLSEDHFIRQAIKFDAEKKYDDALDAIYDGIDDLLIAEDFRQVDSILNAIPIGECSSFFLVGVLTITRSAKEKLASRRNFFAIAELFLQQNGRNTASLLNGLS